MTMDQKAQVQKMRHAGVGFAQIASCLGISRETVKSFCTRNSLIPGACNVDPEETMLDGVTCRQFGKPLDQTPKQKPKAMLKNWYAGSLPDKREFKIPIKIG